MRRAQWSFLDLLPWDSSTTSGSWTIAATTLAARTGSGPNGMRASWDGVTKGTAYQTLPFQSNTARFSHWRGGVALVFLNLPAIFSPVTFGAIYGQHFPRIRPKYILSVT